MSDFAKLNGTAVRTTGTYRRVIEQPGGPPLTEYELVVIVRGSMANRSLRQLLSHEPILVEATHAGLEEAFEAELADVQVASSGSGESAAYRYDLTLRETPASAAKRAAERPHAPAPEAAPVYTTRGPRAPEIDEADDDPDAPLDLSKVHVTQDAAVWATALKQLKSTPGVRPSAPEPPLGPVELAGIEAVLTNLRIDALLDLLEIRGIMQRDDVESHFTKLVRDRFVAEATPVIGEQAAKRGLRDLVESSPKTRATSL